MLRNVNGSFYDFCAQRCVGTSTISLDQAPDPWGGRAAVQWALKLSDGKHYDSSIENSVRVAEVIDAMYNRGDSTGTA
jgi:hypothetical protein